jgi:hypothetical protein
MLTAEKRKWIEDILGVTVPQGNGVDGPPVGAEAQAGAGDEAGGGVWDTIKGWFGGKKKPEPQKPVPRADLGQPQQDRADKLLGAMSDDDRKKVQKLLDDAPADQKKYLTKAIATKHTAAEIEAFARKIAGKDQKWMDENLHLVGLSEGKGIKQQWADSCGPTTVQAMKGELDPIYALKLHEENTDITKADDSDGTDLNAKMAAEQKKNLEDHGGIAVNRDHHGAGMTLTGHLNEQTDKLGVKFDIESVGTDDGMTKGLNDAEAALKKGLPVPVRVGGDNGGHFVLMTGVEDGPPRRYSFHDPWEGKTLVFTDEQIKQNKINIAGWTKMTHIYNPSEAGGP